MRVRIAPYVVSDKIDVADILFMIVCYGEMYPLHYVAFAIHLCFVECKHSSDHDII